MRTRILLLSVAMLLALSTISHGAGVESIDMVRSRFFADFATFNAGDHNRLEVYYKIFNDGLHYVKKGDKYVANYEINVIVLGEKDQQITAQSVDKTYVLDDYELTQSQKGFLVNQISLDIAPGRYGLICKLVDHNSKDVSTVESKIDSPVFAPGASLSDIEFLQDVKNVGDDSRFLKHGKAAVPSVERTFDNEEQPLGFYVEAYVGDYLNQNLTLRWDVSRKHSDTDTTGTLPVTASDSVVAVTDFISLASLSPGEYELTLDLLSGAKPIASRSIGFFIKWSIASLVKNDFDYAVEQLKYVTTKDEREKLRNAPDSLRLKEFNALWASKDPTPGTPQNELRDEYYRRIRYANQYYHGINREGWQTDRGMVYIKYGEPDQIDRHPFELERKPYQIWYYYAQRRIFVFEDTRGDGDYQLQYPFDGDWRYYQNVE